MTNTTIVNVAEIITLLNICLIMANRTLWLQILLMTTLVALVGTILIFSGVELLGLSVLIVYNGALLVLFTMAFLIVTPTQMRSANSTKLLWSSLIVGLMVLILGYQQSFQIEQTIIPYTDWGVLMQDNSMKTLNVALYSIFADEFVGILILLTVGILGALKITKK